MGEETNKYYIGITLGPIHRFLGCAKSTRSIWASSYLFAYIGKHLIRKYYENKRRILKPQISDEMFSMHDGVGRFPDQYIFEVDKEFDINDLRKESDAVLDNLAYNIAQVLGEEQNEYEVKILPQTTQTTPYTTQTIVDSSLAPGARSVMQAGANGCKVTTYKEVYLNGVQISREEISNDTYQVMTRIVKVGPSVN